MMRWILSLMLAMPMAANAACRAGQVEFRNEGGTSRFAVEVADDSAERARGLMFRDSLPTSAGMLFLYDRPQSASFWMRNTLIPLDIIFLDRTGRVTRVHPRARPRDETPIPGGDDVLAVVEINGGLAARLGIAEGSAMRHPALDQSLAVWPCAE